MKRSGEYRKIARESLKNNWGMAVIVCLLISAVDGALCATGFGSIISLLITGPVLVALIIFFEKMINKQSSTYEDFFRSCADNFIENMTAYLVRTLYTLLWSLLFVIPGIIKSYSYAMTMYIKSKQPSLGSQRRRITHEQS